MSRESQSALFTQVDITAGTHIARPREPQHAVEENSALLRDILSAQDRTNELLEEMVAQMAAGHRQRASELNQWKEANPELAESCRLAAEALSRVQISFLDSMTQEINENEDHMGDGEYMFNEFVDRYGPRLAHLNGVIQVLAQLSNVPNPTGESESA
jgi:hypothetical protein